MSIYFHCNLYVKEKTAKAHAKKVEALKRKNRELLMEMQSMIKSSKGMSPAERLLHIRRRVYLRDSVFASNALDHEYAMLEKSMARSCAVNEEERRQTAFLTKKVRVVGIHTILEPNRYCAGIM